MQRGWTPRPYWPARLFVAGLALAAAAIVFAFRWQTPPPASALENTAPRAPSSSSSSSPAPASAPAPVNAQPVPIQSALRLPDGVADGAFVFRGESTFSAFLGKSYKRFMKYNALNFSKQMAIVYVITHNSGGTTVGFDSITRTEKEIVVRIRSTQIRGAVTAAVTQSVIGVSVKKSNLPVRFEFVDVAQN